MSVWLHIFSSLVRRAGEKKIDASRKAGGLSLSLLHFTRAARFVIVVAFFFACATQPRPQGAFPFWRGRGPGD